MNVVSIGMVLIGNNESDREYAYTNSKTLIEVTSLNEDGTFKGKILATFNEKAKMALDHEYYRLNSIYFEICSLEQFNELAKVSGNEIFLSKELLKGIHNMEIFKDLNVGEEYTLTDAQREALSEEIKTLTREYGYNPTQKAINMWLDEWATNKGWIIRLFEKSPYYNGNFQIVFPETYPRNIDKNEINNFTSWIKREASNKLLKEVKIGPFSYYECLNLKEKYAKLKNLIYEFPRNNKTFNRNEMLLQADIEYKKWLEKVERYTNDENIYISGDTAYERASYNNHQGLQELYYSLSGWLNEQFIDKRGATKINNYFPTVKATVGQKWSRVINKICKLVGVDKKLDYNARFAKFADAVTETPLDRNTILSIHPIDYLTMSFGNSWASCHTIDKENVRDMPDDYSGQYSNGTVSYMLDGSSFVYYMINKSYDGNCPELESKINRCMFHIGENKIIQGRMYPQSNDGCMSIYKKVREVAQKTIAECLGVPNLWINVKGTYECSNVTMTYGSHYPDYKKFDSCNVSYYNDGTELKNYNKIKIGHTGICLHCGSENNWSDAIECRCCYSNEKECDNCGCTCDVDYMYQIDDNFYCEDCTFYCEYHDCREVDDGNNVHIRYVGRVCNDALDSGDYDLCEHCGEWVGYAPESVRDTDGNYFCSEQCAERHGLVYIDRSYNDSYWTPNEEARHCECCGETVHESQYDEDYNCCDNCLEEVIAQTESETNENAEEREAM